MELSSEEWKEVGMSHFVSFRDWDSERKGGTLVFVRRRIFVRLFRVFFPFDFLFFPSDL